MEGIDLNALCKELGERGIDGLLIEGGSTLHAGALQAGIVDRSTIRSNLGAVADTHRYAVKACSPRHRLGNLSVVM